MLPATIGVSEAPRSSETSSRPTPIASRSVAIGSVATSSFDAAWIATGEPSFAVASYVALSKRKTTAL